MKSILLASQSPRRKQLLELAEIPFSLLNINAEEQFPVELNPENVALFIAKNKMKIAWREAGNTDNIIITADTIVVLENTIIGKPGSSKEAIETLNKLSGKWHQVITGVVLKSQRSTFYLQEITEVYFNELSLEQIVHYVEKYQPLDKAGAYAIQEWIGIIGVGSIKGDYYNVMGLPVNKVAAVIKKMNISSSSD